MSENAEFPVSVGVERRSVLVLCTNTCGNFMDKEKLAGNRWMPHVLCMKVEQKVCV